MKKINLYGCIACAMIITMFSCGDEQQYLPAVVPTDGTNAKVKFIHAASDTVGVNVYFNNVKLSGNAQNVITSTGAVNIGTVTYQNAFPVTNYTSVVNSSGNFAVVVPQVFSATETFPTKTMATLQASLSPSAFYTVAFVGASPDYEAVLYQDNLSTTPVNGKIYVRFANFIHNLEDNVNVKATPPADKDDPNPTPIMLFENVSFKDMTGFVELPKLGTYTNVQVINANTSAVIATLAANVSTFVPNKVYTVFARGRVGAGGTAAPGVSRMINR